MMQFAPTIEVKSLSKMLVMMDPNLPIFDDPQRERTYFDRRKDMDIMHAKAEQESKKHLKQKKIPTELLEFEDMPTVVSASSPPQSKGKAMDIEMAKLTSTKTERSQLLQNEETLADDDLEDQDKHNAHVASNYEPFKQPPEIDKTQSLWRNQQPLDEFLLFYSFIVDPNSDIPLTAMSAVSENMTQRERVVQLVQQVQVLVSEEDTLLYNKLKYFKDRMEMLIKAMVFDEFTLLIYSLNQQEKANSSLRDFQQVTRRMTFMLRESHGL